MELKKSHLSKLVGGVETQNRRVPHPPVVDKNSGGISQEPNMEHNMDMNNGVGIA